MTKGKPPKPEDSLQQNIVEVSLHLSLDPLQVVNTGTVSPKMAVLESGQLAQAR